MPEPADLKSIYAAFYPYDPAATQQQNIASLEQTLLRTQADAQQAMSYLYSRLAQERMPKAGKTTVSRTVSMALASRPAYEPSMEDLARKIALCWVATDLMNRAISDQSDSTRPASVDTMLGNLGASVAGIIDSLRRQLKDAERRKTRGGSAGSAAAQTSALAPKTPFAAGGLSATSPFRR